MIRSSRRRGGWGPIVGFSFLALLVIAFGTYFMWAQHSGVPDRVTVERCQTRSGRHMFFDYVIGDSCTGRPSTGQRHVEFTGVYRKDIGRGIDVHITRGIGTTDEAVPDAWIVPPIAIGVGGVLGVAVVIGIVRRLRFAPVAAEGTGRPWPGANS
jgi:hypothetical protein